MKAILLALVLPSAAGGSTTVHPTGWQLLKVTPLSEIEIEIGLPPGGYRVEFDAIFRSNGRVIGQPISFHGPGPGVYANADGLANVAVAPQPEGGAANVGTLVHIPPPGWPLGETYYVLIAVAGEVSSYTMNGAEPSWTIASGPTHFARGSDMESEIFVEAKAAMVSAYAGTTRRMTFEVNDSLVGMFGSYSLLQHYKRGPTSLTLPNGTTLLCPCDFRDGWGGFFPGPGTYVYEDSRKSVDAFYVPPAIWADVPLSLVQW